MMHEMSALARSIGHKIRQCRLNRNLTQEELAQGLFSKSYISQLERGIVNPSLRALRLIAQRLGVSCSWLLESGNSLPSLLIQAATTSYYLGETRHAEELLEKALTHDDSFSERDHIEALLLQARLFSDNEQWEKVLDTCRAMDPLMNAFETLPRRFVISQQYLWGMAWFHMGNRRQAIHHWEHGLAELNRFIGPPTDEGLRLLQALVDLYATLGDQNASDHVNERLQAIAAQIVSPADMSRWTLARRQGGPLAGCADMDVLSDEADNLNDAEAWARANLVLTHTAELRGTFDNG